MATMKDVAELAEVSSSTVSRVLSKKVSVADKTRKRVEEAIKSLEYTPNLLASGLSRQSGNLIGFIVPEIMQPTFPIFFKYIEEATKSIGFNLIVGNTQNDLKLEKKFIKNLLQRKVDGIIFSSVAGQSSVYELFSNRKVPCVLIDRILQHESIPSIMLDNYKAGQLAATHLLDMNHRNLFVVTGPLDVPLSHERLNGFLDTLEENNVKIENRMIYKGDFSFQSGQNAVKYIMDNKLNVSAIWGANDLCALGVIKELYKNKISVPDQISVLGVDDIQESMYFYPELTTIKQPFSEMCDKAVQLLINQKSGDMDNKNRIVFAPRLVVRGTTKMAR